MGVPLVEVLNPYRAMLAVLYPQSGELTGVVRASSVVYIGCRLTFAAAAGGLRDLEAPQVESGPERAAESCEKEGEVEVVETLVEIEEELAEAPVAVGSAAMVAGGSSVVSDREADVSHYTDHSKVLAAASGPNGGGESGGEPGPTTGLHVPRRTHRRIGATAKPYRHPWTNPDPLARAHDTGLRRAGRSSSRGATSCSSPWGWACSSNWAGAWRTRCGRAWCMIPVGLTILSLVLVNAQGVTALTSERDTGALDLLLVTELSPKEFIYGKLYGVLYNSKEMIGLPVITAIALFAMGLMSGENLVFFLIDFLLLCHFAAMLGLHAAITYTSSRTAVANSLGTIFFLMVGILLCSFLIALSDREFGRQLLSFMIFIGAGSVALFGSLGAKNPSQAIAWVAVLTPFWTFYCIISLVNGDLMAAFLVSAGVYGFAILAMLVPAVGDFDIALGRTNAIQG